MTEQKKDDAKRMTADERMESIIYQFITLYERWAEDRQVAAKQGADTAKLVKEFTNQVEHFEKMGPDVREHLIKGIREAFSDVNKQINQTINDVATAQMDQPMRALKQTANDAGRYITTYHDEMVADKGRSFWRTVLIAVGASVAVSLIVVELLLPANMYSLSKSQLNEMHMGQTIAAAWPKLKSNEKNTILNLLDKAQKRG